MDLTELADDFVAFMQAFWLSVLIIGAGVSIRERFWRRDIADRRQAVADPALEGMDDLGGPGLSPRA